MSKYQKSKTRTRRRSSEKQDEEKYHVNMKKQKQGHFRQSESASKNEDDGMSFSPLVPETVKTAEKSGQVLIQEPASEVTYSSKKESVSGSQIYHRQSKTSTEEKAEDEVSQDKDFYWYKNFYRSETDKNIEQSGENTEEKISGNSAHRGAGKHKDDPSVSKKEKERSQKVYQNTKSEKAHGGGKAPSPTASGKVWNKKNKASGEQNGEEVSGTAKRGKDRGYSSEIKTPKRERNKYQKSGKIKKERGGRRSFYHYGTAVLGTAYHGSKEIVRITKNATEKTGEQDQQLAVERGMNDVIQKTIRKELLVTERVTRKPVQWLLGHIGRLIKNIAVRLIGMLWKFLVMAAPILIPAFGIVVILAVILNAGNQAFRYSPLGWLQGINLDLGIMSYIEEKEDKFWAEVLPTLEQDSDADHVIILINGQDSEVTIDNHYEILLAYMAEYSTYLYEANEDGYGYGVEDNVSSMLSDQEAATDFQTILEPTEENKENADRIFDEMVNVSRNTRNYSVGKGETITYEIINIKIHSYDCYEKNHDFTELQQKNGDSLLEVIEQLDGYDDHPEYASESESRQLLEELIAEASEDEEAFLKKRSGDLGAYVTYDPDFVPENGYNAASYSSELISEYLDITVSSIDLTSQINRLKASGDVESYDPNVGLRTGDVLYYYSGDNRYKYVSGVYIYAGNGYGFTASSDYRQVILKRVPLQNPEYVVHLLEVEEE